MNADRISKEENKNKKKTQHINTAKYIESHSMRLLFPLFLHVVRIKLHAVFIFLHWNPQFKWRSISLHPIKARHKNQKGQCQLSIIHSSYESHIAIHTNFWLPTAIAIRFFKSNFNNSGWWWMKPDRNEIRRINKFRHGNFVWVFTKTKTKTKEAKVHMFGISINVQMFWLRYVHKIRLCCYGMCKPYSYRIFFATLHLFFYSNALLPSF